MPWAPQQRREEGQRGMGMAAPHCEKENQPGVPETRWARGTDGDGVPRELPHLAARVPGLAWGRAGLGAWA